MSQTEESSGIDVQGFAIAAIGALALIGHIIVVRALNEQGRRLSALETRAAFFLPEGQKHPETVKEDE